MRGRSVMSTTPFFKRSWRCITAARSQWLCDLDVIILQSIRRLRIKFIRKLGRARGRVSLNIVKKRDIIADYSDPSSQARFHALEL